MQSILHRAWGALFVLGSLLLLPATSRAQRLPTYANFKRVPKSAYEVVTPGEKGPTRVKLQRPVKVAGVAWQDTLELIWEWGRAVVLNGTLARDYKKGRVTYQSGKPISFSYSGKQVLRGFLARDQQVQGLPLKGGREVAYYESGKLWKGTLSTDHTVGPLPCKGGAPISLSKQGRVYACTLARDVVLGGWPAKGGTRFRLYRRGKPRAKLVLARNHKIGPVELQAGSKVSFDNPAQLDEPTFGQLKLHAGVLAATTTLNGVPCQGGQKVKFHGAATQLAACTLASPIAIGPGIKPPAGTRVWRSANGRVVRFRLAQKQLFHNTEYPPGHDIHLDDAGKVVKVTRVVKKAR